jgi:hypothetical protein
MIHSLRHVLWTVKNPFPFLGFVLFLPKMARQERESGGGQ